ncbi:MAG TPA: alanine racemase [Mycobacterium sp.]|nr:alanine racemase [Mycobacterium sp.]
MSATIGLSVVASLSDEPLDGRWKGLPAGWDGKTPAQICASSPELFAAGPLGPVCVLHADALAHNVATMAQWCTDHAVELAPHGKTHMSPQLLARQFAAGACAVTVATISQARTYRSFGVSDIIVANELVDPSGLRWLAKELDANPDFQLCCWVDSVAGVKLMSQTLEAAGARRPVDVCVEVGVPGGRTGARTPAEIDAVARAVAETPRLRLIGVAGYEGALGHDISPAGRAAVVDYLGRLRAAVIRQAGLFETDEIVVTAGGSTFFDLVAQSLTHCWPTGYRVRTILRSGCYLTHDDGLYARTSPLRRHGLLPALSVWAQVCSTPEPDLALLTMGRRDVSFDQDLPVPRGVRATVTKLNDQHAFLRTGDVRVGDWLEFGISHPCTVFDKWPMIPVLDGDNRVLELVRTFF